MKKLAIIMFIAFIIALLSSCAVQGEKGDAGLKGDTGATGAQGPKGDTGAQGPQGVPGQSNITSIVPLCPNTPAYGQVYTEVALCINNQLYAVYSANGGFLTLLTPGTYSSNAIGSRCNLIVAPNCVVRN